MKQTASSTQADRQPTGNQKGTKRTGRVHPVIIYPFARPSDYGDLEELYRWVATLGQSPQRYARPITVIDRKTHYLLREDPAFVRFRKECVGKHSDIMDSWCVDTCQMWYTGLGYAFGEEAGRRAVFQRLMLGALRLALAGTRKVFFQNPDDRDVFLSRGLLRDSGHAVLIKH